MPALKGATAEQFWASVKQRSALDCRKETRAQPHHASDEDANPFGAGELRYARTEDNRYGPDGRAKLATAEIRQLKTETLRTRLVAVDRAVLRWQSASALRIAYEAAEEARNLIVGPSGPFYGDANKDGQISGKSIAGVLPGLKGEAALASLNDNACVVADILGGSWRDPANRWSQFQSALSRWTISRNTFPSLPSHAQRVVGWASLTLKSDSLVEAREYAKHVRLHVDISVRAVNSCRC